MKIEFIDPGRFRTPMLLERRQAVADGAGGWSERWEEIAALWGRLETVSAKAVFGADGMNEVVTHRVTLRYRDDIESGMRLKSGARLFAIRTVHDPDETRRYLVCTTREEGR